MKTKKTFNHSIAMYMAIFSFLFTIPVFSGGPALRFNRTKPSREMRIVFRQLEKQTEEIRMSLVYKACEYGTTDKEAMTFAEAQSSLKRTAQEIEKTLVYLAPAPTEATADDLDTERILTTLQVEGKKIEDSLAYITPELNL